MSSLPEESPSRISEADRETAVQRLKEAYAEEHISHEDMDERLGQVLTARTHGELASALVSLPENPDESTSSTDRRRRWGIRRRGVWRVPRFLKVESAFRQRAPGSVPGSHRTPGGRHRAATRYRRARITVPRDAIVEIEDLHTEWKDTRYKARRSSRGDGPKIRISGTWGSDGCGSDTRGAETPASPAPISTLVSRPSWLAGPIATMVNARDHGLPQPAADYVMSPYVDLTLSGTSMRTKHQLDPLLSPENLRPRIADYTAGQDAATGLISPRGRSTRPSRTTAVRASRRRATAQLTAVRTPMAPALGASI